MLTEDEKQRIRTSVPTSYSVDWDGVTYTHTNIPRWWENQDHDISLPQIVLGWNVQGVERSDAQPLNQVLETRMVNTKQEVTRGARLYDEMMVEFTVEAGQDENDVPAPVRANKLGGELVEHFRYVFSQNSVGSNGERPVVARVDGEPMVVPGELDGDDVLRAQFSVQFDYTDEYVQEDETAETVETDVTVNHQ